MAVCVSVSGTELGSVDAQNATNTAAGGGENMTVGGNITNAPPGSGD